MRLFSINKKSGFLAGICITLKLVICLFILAAFFKRIIRLIILFPRRINVCDGVLFLCGNIFLIANNNKRWYNACKQRNKTG